MLPSLFPLFFSWRLPHSSLLRNSVNYRRKSFIVQATAYYSTVLTDENDVVGLSVGRRDLRVDGDGSELRDDARPDDDGSAEERRNGLVHQRVSLDEVEVGVR
jgi:hypothetical protein